MVGFSRADCLPCVTKWRFEGETAVSSAKELTLQLSSQGSGEDLSSAEVVDWEQQKGHVAPQSLSVTAAMCRAVSGPSKTQRGFERVSHTHASDLLLAYNLPVLFCEMKCEEHMV